MKHPNETQVLRVPLHVSVMRRTNAQGMSLGMSHQDAQDLSQLLDLQ